MRRTSKKQQTRSEKPQATRDSFANFAAATGVNTDNQTNGSAYVYGGVSRNRNNLDQAYRSSWVVGVAVDAVAEDMTRAGVELISDTPPDELEKIHTAASELGVWDSLCSTIKWARLYGGACALMHIEGQDVSTPLRIETIAKGQFKGLLPLDRWVLTPSTETVQELGLDYGKPKFYSTVADGQGLKVQKIHYSRLIRFDGVELPHFQRAMENGWGQSILERLYDRLVAFDSTTQGAAQLAYKAHLRTYKVEGLRQLIAGGGDLYDALLKQIDLIRKFQSNEGLTLMDGSDTFEAHQYTFAGLSDLMMQFAQQISGALQIPMVRLFGQSPTGFNSGDADIRMYYDGIAREQTSRLRHGVRRLYELISLSALGKPLAEGTQIKFKSLWQMSETERAAIAQTVTTTVTTAMDSGLALPKSLALKELRQASAETGMWSNITDEMIAAAEQDEIDVPPAIEGDSGNVLSLADRIKAIGAV